MANYDSKPSILEAVGNGSYLYRYNIEEKIVENVSQDSDNKTVETKTSWECDEVTVWAPLTANKITEAVISAVCPVSHEQKLVNEYNAAQLGMIGSSNTSDEAKKKIAAYKEFLEYRSKLKAQVDADCDDLGIE